MSKEVFVERRVAERRRSPASPGLDHGLVLWRTAAMFLLGLVVSMATFYIAEFRHSVSRQEVAALIDDLRPRPPWAVDRGSVMERLDRLERGLDACTPRREFDAYIQQQKRR